MRLLIIIAIALTSALVVAACGAASTYPSSTGTDPTGREPLATIEREACFGLCPIYRVTIFRDGVVEYEGIRFVKVQGRATDQLSAQQLDQLRRLFERSGYLRLANSYTRQNVTDLPTVITSYSPSPDRTKTIRHYLGDRSAPRVLTRVEEGIDRIINIEQWIGTPEERQNLPRA